MSNVRQPEAVPDELEQRAISEPVRLVPHDVSWATSFGVEQTRLAALFPQFRQIEHIGSTAVPGMIAKPIVDMLAGVDSMAVADGLFDPIVQCGYSTSRAFNATLPDRRWFMRSKNGQRTHHLHVVVFCSPTWVKHLQFRDLLRSNAELAAKYAELKASLAARFEHDRETYTDAKSEFVANALAVA